MNGEYEKSVDIMAGKQIALECQNEWMHCMYSRKYTTTFTSGRQETKCCAVHLIATLSEVEKVVQTLQELGDVQNIRV